MNKKTKSLIAGLIVVNLLFALSIKSLFFLKNKLHWPYEELKECYPRFCEIIYWLAQKITPLFWLWLIAFVALNGFLIYRLAKQTCKLKELIVFSVAMLLSFVAAEFILRKFNYKPGTHTYVRYFTPVDSLYMLEGFTADSSGIFKVDLAARQKVCQNISAKNTTYSAKQIHEVFSLASESIELMEGQANTNFARLYKQLSVKDSSTLLPLEKAIIDFVHCPINADGFRSIAFKHYAGAGKKVLLLGDSFTWGHSSSKKSFSFSDELLAKGYVVYNAGISATDVAQYLAIAKQYIPVLKPDVVIVNFFLGNDVTYYRREVKPYAPVLFATNAGNLIACPQGNYFENAQQVYNLYLHQWQIPEDDNIINCLMAQSVITTLAWRALVKLEIANYGNSDVEKYYHKAEKRKYAKPYCNIELNEIRNIAENNGAEFILSSLPEVYTYTFNTQKDFPNLFEGLEYVEMEVSKSDYKLEDGHFNNEGHKKYAAFLIEQIEKP